MTKLGKRAIAMPSTVRAVADDLRPDLDGGVLNRPCHRLLGEPDGTLDRIAGRAGHVDRTAGQTGNGIGERADTRGAFPDAAAQSDAHSPGLDNVLPDVVGRGGGE